MNKTAIKNFAIWARNKLIADIKYKAGLMGITEKGIANALPQSTSGTEFYDIGTAEPYAIIGKEIEQRKRLKEVIENRSADTNYATAYKYIMEEVAYTWFNRLIAVRFMEVNDYLPGSVRVLSSETGKMEPDLVTNPFDSGLEFSDKEEEIIIQLKQDNKLDELFRMLFVKQCNALNELLPSLFEKTNDYTEILLNLSIVDKEGVVGRLIHDIPEEDFDVDRGGQVEIIGWLYQYYNTEPKNDAFAKIGKITKEEIPAVTQLFTPDWIVRYMVENSLGRLWLEGHPDDSLKAKWKYYLDEAQQEPDVEEKLIEIREEYKKLNPEDIKLIDPCMGSGHILVYAFDVLMQIYESAGWSQRDAAKSIVENNIYGLDIDDRAFQMAYFAVMMKARQYNRRILSTNVKSHVYSMQESNDVAGQALQYMGMELSCDEKKQALEQVLCLLKIFKDAKEYGSLLSVPKMDWELLRRFASVQQNDGQIILDLYGEQSLVKKLQSIIDRAEVLSQQYHVVVTNPPYMGMSGMNSKLASYIKENYCDYKSDLFSVFIIRCIQYAEKYGKLSFLTPYVWMFILSYAKLREVLINQKTLSSLIQFEYSSFEEAIVPICTFSFTNTFYPYKASYIRLTDFRGGMDIQEKKTLDAISNHECGYYYERDTESFSNVPDTPIAYWQRESFFRSFLIMKKLGEYVSVKKGLTTADNDRFIRNWWEVNIFKSNCLSNDKDRKWIRTHKGGEYRKWYGNSESVLNWGYDGMELKSFKNAVIRNENYYFSTCISWNDISSGKAAFRFVPSGSISNASGPSFYGEEKKLILLIALCNSIVVENYLTVLCPTIHFEIGQIAKIPVGRLNEEKIAGLSQSCINITRNDWNCFEKSWDYVAHSFIIGETMGKLIADKYKAWEQECECRFNQLKANEEELNRIFIDIYGLQDELTPEVEDKDVTVRKAELQRDIKSLLSYAVGCMFGRYSLDVEGLAYAGGEWDNSKYSTFIPDEDGIIPITDEEYLEDDIVGLLCGWLKKVYGADTLEENLDFIAKALGNKGSSSREIIRNYFLADFYKDHCSTYSVTGSGKRPIYWLFDSGKQNGFKALIYLHRYTPDTIGNLRVDYLHKMQRVYESEINRMQDMIDHSTNNREIAAASKRKEKLQKQSKECRDYDEKIGHLALSRIELDLDDGVKYNYRKLQIGNDGKLYEVLSDGKTIMMDAKKYAEFKKI